MKTFYKVLFFSIAFLGLSRVASAQCTGTPITSFSVTKIVDVSCFGGSDGSIEVTLAGGLAPFNYSLVLETGSGDIPIGSFTNTNSQKVTFTGLFANAPFGGQYKVTLVTSNGGLPAICRSRQISLINVAEPADLTITTNNVNLDCDPTIGTGTGKIDITVAGGTLPYAIIWSGPTAIPNGTQVTASNLDAGSYLVSVTDANSCTNSQNFTISVSTQADAGPNQDVCATSATMAANAAGVSELGTWTVISGSGTFGNANSPTTTITSLSTGANVFEWRITDTGGLCVGTTSQVTINSFTPAIVEAGNANSICAGDLYTLIGSSIGGSATTGTWSIVTQPAGGNGALSNATPTATPATVTFSATVSGSYTLRLTTDDPTGPCPLVTDDVIITVSAAAIATARTDVSMCSGTSITLTGSSVSGSATTGAWSIITQPAGGNGFLNTSAQVASPGSVTFAASVIGSYTLRLTTNDPAGPCAPGTDDVVITVDVAATSEAGNPATICSAEVHTMTGSFVGGSATTGAWSIFSQPAGGNGILSSTAQTATPANITFSATTAGNYTLRLTTNNPAGPCGVVSDNVVITVTAGAVASAGTDKSMCSASVLTLTGASVSGSATTGAWSIVTQPAGGNGVLSSTAQTASPATKTFTASVAGAYTLRLTTNDPAGSCTAVSDDVIITVITPPNAGIDNTVTACNTNASFNLFTSLLGTPDAGGTWSQLTGTTSSTITGNNVNLNGAVAGTYTFQYTVTGTSPCANDVSVVTVNINDAPDAGTDNTVAACNTNAAFNLFTSLLGSPDAGGTWSQLTGTTPSTITGNNVNLNGAVAGTYTFQYTLTGVSPCVNDVSVVTINVNDAPDAGTDNTVAACNTNAAFNLFSSLLGSPDAGGTWSQLTGITPSTITGNNVNLNGAVAGTYTFQYTVTAVAPCINDVSVVTVNVNDAPDAGTDNTVAACNTNASFNLFTSLLGSPDAGGIWTQLTGTTTTTIAGNTVDLNGAVAGTYTFQYTLTGTAPCVNDVSVVTVNVTDAPDAGTDNSVSACNSNASFNLFTSLIGTPDAGGTWIQLTGTTPNTITGNTVNLTGAAAGAYTFQYTVTGVAPCVNDVSVVTVNVSDAPDAGTDNTVSACNTNASFNLFTSLLGSPDAGGTWSQLTGTTPSAITGNNVNLNGAVAGMYTFQYTVTGVAPCVNDVSVVTINVTDAPDAGNDNTVSACNSDAAFNLFTSLLGTPDAGGTWTQLTGTTPSTIAGNNVDLNGAVAGTYTFQYTVTGVAPCANDVSVLTVNASDAPDAGSDNTVTSCNTNGSFDLFISLLGSPDAGGTWSQLTGPGPVTIAGNNVDLNGAIGGTYTFQYTLTGTAPCVNDVSVLTLNLTEAPDAGLDNTVPTCNTNASFDLFASLLGSPDVGGTWSQLTGTTPSTITGNNVDLNGAVAGTYTFQYTVTGVAPCGNDVSIITVNVNDTANAGLDNSVTACNTETAFDLFASLLGVPDAGGIWSDMDGSGAVITGNTVDLSTLAPGTYRYQYTIAGTAPCPNDVSIVTVNVINTVPDAGSDNTVAACNSDAAFDLFASLAGSPDPGGVWSDVDGSSAVISGNTVNLTTLAAGTFHYLYTVTAGACGTASAIVTVNINDTPDAGTNNTVPACNTNASFNLFASLSGSPNVGGTWSQLTGTTPSIITGNNVDLNGATAGTYTFQYTVIGAAPCPNDVAIVTVNVSDSPNAGLDNSVTACSTETAFDLFASLLGTPDPGGVWSDVDGSGAVITGNTVNVSTLTPGAYRYQYTVTGTAPCSNDVSIVTVNVINSAPDAGSDKTVAACNSDSAFDLFANLNGSPDPGGVWSDVDASGAVISGNNVNLTTLAVGTYRFLYTITAGTCGTASATVTVNISNGPDAGSDNTISACNTNSSLDLLASLSGTPDATGSWTQLTGAPRTITGNNVNLNGAIAGTYTFQYTVTGTGFCVDAVSVVTINVIDSPDAGVDNTVLACNTNASFNLFTSLLGTPDAFGTWSQLTGTTPSTITGNNVDLNGAASGTYTFQYTVTGAAPCINDISVVTVNVNAAPSTAVAGPDQVICSGTLATLNATSPVSGSGVWTIFSGLGGTLVTPNSPTSQFVGSLGASYTLRWVVTSGVCTPSTDDVVINFAASPTSTSPITACVNTTAPTLTATATGSTSIQWYTDAGLTNLVFTGASYTPTAAELDMTTVGSMTFFVTAQYSCGSSPAKQVVVNVSNTGVCGSGPNCFAFATSGPVVEVRPSCGNQNDGQLIFNVKGGTGTYVVTLYDSITVPIFTKAKLGSSAASISFGSLSASNNYFYKIDDGVNTCTLPYSLPIQTTVTATADGSSFTNVACFGEPVGSAIINATGSSTGEYWYSIDANIWKKFVPGNAGEIIDLPPNNTYTILVGEVPNDVCYDTAKVTINNSNPDLTITYSTTEANCNSSNGSITITPPTAPNIGGGGPYMYALKQGTNVTAFQSELVFDNLGGGTYSILIQDGISCIKTISGVVVPLPGSISPTITKSDADCTNNGNSGALTVVINDPGTYKVAVSSDPFNEPADSEYKNYIAPSAPFTNLSNGSYYVYIRSSAIDCAIKSDEFIIGGSYAINFDIVPICINNDVSLKLDNITGQPSSSAPDVGNISLTVINNLGQKLIDEFGLGQLAASYTLLKVNPVYSQFLQVPGEYEIYLTQIQVDGSSGCPMSSDTIDYVVNIPLSAQIGMSQESYYDVASGSLQLVNFTGGLAPYSAQIELDSAVSNLGFESGLVSVTQNNNFKYEVTFNNVPAGRYKVEVMDFAGCVIGLTSRVSLDTDIFIPNIFTPNGDESNQTFEIRNLPLTSKATLVITNRWGKQVYISKDYKNTWDGEENAEGIYFYRLQIGKDQPITGWVEIRRGNKP